MVRPSRNLFGALVKFAGDSQDFEIAIALAVLHRAIVDHRNGDVKATRWLEGKVPDALIDVSTILAGTGLEPEHLARWPG